MKKKFFLFILLFITSPSLYAQIEGIPGDSISYYLSQKWKEKARFIDRHQIAIFGDAMVYEFRADSSFVKKYDNKDAEGTWSYDSTKKVIRLTIDNQTDFYVVVLSKTELLLAAELHEGADKGSGILVLLHKMD